eukprot:g29324.t1
MVLNLLILLSRRQRGFLSGSWPLQRQRIGGTAPASGVFTTTLRTTSILSGIKVLGLWFCLQSLAPPSPWAQVVERPALEVQT